MEALGQLTGGLAHDFNNLLTAILGACELGLRNIGDEKKVQRMLEGVRGSAQRGASLTKQLLAFARAQPLEIKQIDLRQFFAEVATLVRPSLRSDIDVVTEISDQLWPVDADAGALELALLNLAFNARDAMKEGGTLKISAHNEVLHGSPEGLKGRARHTARLRHRQWHVARGHRARVRALLHDQELRRGHGARPQPGVRLRQADRRRRHRGVQDRARVPPSRIYLPASHGSDAEQGSMNGSRSLGRVLLVEDDTFVAELAADMLAELGFESTIVHSAKEALAQLAAGTSRSSSSPTS